MEKISENLKNEIKTKGRVILAKNKGRSGLIEYNGVEYVIHNDRIITREEDIANAPYNIFNLISDYKAHIISSGPVPEEIKKTLKDLEDYLNAPVQKAGIDKDGIDKDAVRMLEYKMRELRDLSTKMYQDIISFRQKIDVTNHDMSLELSIIKIQLQQYPELVKFLQVQIEAYTKTVLKENG